MTDWLSDRKALVQPPADDPYGLTMEPALIPPDFDRCQCESSSFMQFGPGTHRCGRVPLWIAREPDEPHGEMSLCAEHRLICERQQPNVTYRPILGPRFTARLRELGS